MQEMQLGGPLKDTKILGFIPGPGKYESNKSMLDQRASSLHPRLPDTSQRHLEKVEPQSLRTLDPALTKTKR
jgi:hypothetical protein